jgi:hypothetical protein
MADLPIDKKAKKPDIIPADKIEVTHENADLLAVHFLAQLHGRLGYIIKLLEEKK